MQILEKRSSEQVRYDIDCSALLTTGETISSVTSVTADANTGTSLTFGTPATNSTPSTYTDTFGSTRITPAYTVIQVEIRGGSVPTGAQVNDYIVRAKFVTSVNPVVEATVRLRLNDTPPA